MTLLALEVGVAEDEKAMADCMDCVRAVSVDQLKRYARLSEVKAATATAAELPFCQQMAHVLIFGDDVELNFKAHFMFDEATKLAAHKLGKDIVPRNQAIDFMKEFCNLVAGRTKALLEALGLTLGQSLPFSMQGYNEIFYPEKLVDGWRDAWLLEAPAGSVTCSATLFIRNKAALPRLAQISFTPESGKKSSAIEMF